MATICGLREQTVAPTANFVEADPECVVPVTALEPFAHDVAISNSFAFGGLNAVLAFKR